MDKNEAVSEAINQSRAAGGARRYALLKRLAALRSAAAFLESQH